MRPFSFSSSFYWLSLMQWLVPNVFSRKKKCTCTYVYILVCVKSLQLCLTLCDTMNCNLQRSSVHRILQARILWWVALPSSRESSQPRNRNCNSFGSWTAGRLFTAEPLEKPIYIYTHIHAYMVNHLPAMQETQVWFLCWEDPLEKEMSTHSSILAWRIQWTEEPGGLQSMRLQESDTT